ncbi:MAG: hypothetical protein IJQ12_05845 [Lachnospiraceae bacterium]|nr:hypothetical protein [Lachnospiraceae bacterium]
MSGDENGVIGEKIAAFYDCYEPDKRRLLLAEIKESGNDPEADVRETVFFLRHGEAAHPSKQKDMFLMNYIYLIQIQDAKPMFSPASVKEIRKLLSELGTSVLSKYGERGRDVLHAELANAAERYFLTCQDPGYKKKFFGLIQATGEERSYYIRKDAHAISFGAVENAHLDQKETDEPLLGVCAILIEAVCDAYRKMFPEEAPLQP